MGWFTRQVEKTAHQAVDRYLHSPAFERMVHRVAFVSAMAWRMRQTDKTMTVDGARALAETALSTYLADEKIEFGDARYGWTFRDAFDVIEEQEIRHWEAAA
jgi:hypothetical protein